MNDFIAPQLQFVTNVNEKLSTHGSAKPSRAENFFGGGEGDGNNNVSTDQNNNCTLQKVSNIVKSAVYNAKQIPKVLTRIGVTIPNLQRVFKNSLNPPKEKELEDILYEDRPNLNAIKLMDHIESNNEESLTDDNQSSCSQWSAADSCKHLISNVKRFDKIEDDPDDFIAFDFKMIQGRPHMLCKLQERDTNVPCLVDSGSGYCLLSSDHFRILQSENPSLVLGPCPLKLVSHSGHPLPVIGAIRLPLWAKDCEGIERKIYNLEWLVLEGGQPPLLGTSLTRRFGGRIDFDDSRLEHPESFGGKIMLHKDNFKDPMEDRKKMPERNSNITFTFHPIKATTLYPGREHVVRCRVKPDNYLHENKLRNEYGILHYNTPFSPDGFEEVVSEISKDLEVLVRLKNHANDVASIIDHHFQLGHGTLPRELSDERVIADMSHVISALQVEKEIPCFNYDFCPCEINDEQIATISFCDMYGNTSMPFFSANSELQITDNIRNFQSVSLSRGLRFFIRSGRIDEKIAKRLVRKLNPKSKLIVTGSNQSQNFSLVDSATLRVISEEAKAQGHEIICGIFKPCSRHSCYQLDHKDRTIVYFSHADTDRTKLGEPFVVNKHFRTIKSDWVYGRNFIQVHSTKKNQNLDSFHIVWVKVPAAYRSNVYALHACVRNAFHWIQHATNPTKLTIVTDDQIKIPSAMNLQQCVFNEISSAWNPIYPAKDIVKEMDEANIKIAHYVYCLYRAATPIQSIKFQDTACANYQAHIVSALDCAASMIPDNLPNPETKKGYNDAIKAGLEFTPDEKFKTYLAGQEKFPLNDNYPKAARDDASMVSDPTVHKLEARLPDEGPGAKGDLPKSWREIGQDPIPEDAPAEMKKFYHELFDEFNDCCQKRKGQIRAIRVPPLDINMKEENCLRKPYPASPRQREIMYKMLDQLADEGFLERVITSKCTSPCFLVERNTAIKDMPLEEKLRLEKTDPRKVYRLVANLDAINKLVDLTCNEMMSADQVIDAFQGFKVFGKADLAELFHMIPVTKKLKEALSLIAFPNKIYSPNFCLEGYKNIPMYAAQVVQFHIRKRCHDRSTSFLDDIGFFAKDKEEFRKVIRDFFLDLRESNALLNLGKLEVEVTEFNFLGLHFKLDEDGILTYLPMTQRYQIFENVEVATVADLMKFLGMVAFVSGFVGSLATLCAPLYAILAAKNGMPKNTKVEMDSIQKDAFNALKARLMRLERLTVPGIDSKLVIAVDTNLQAYGAILLVEVHGKLRIASYSSKRFSDAFIRSNSSMSREANGVLQAVTKHQKRILCAESTQVWSDCKVFCFLASRTSPTSSVIPARWLAILSEFPVKYVYTPRYLLSGPDYLGRLNYEFTEILTTPANEEESYKKISKCQIPDDLLEPGKAYTMKELQEIGMTSKVLKEDHECAECKVPDPLPVGHVNAISYEDVTIENLIAEWENPTRHFPICSIQEKQEVKLSDIPTPENVQFSVTRIIEEQQKNEFSRDMIQLLQTKSPESRYEHHSALWGLLDGVLLVRRVVKHSEKRQDLRVYLPYPFVNEYISKIHRIGHSGIDRLHKVMQLYFYHHRLRKLITKFVGACPECLYYKVATNRNLPLGMLRPATYLFEQLYLDYFYMTPTRYKGVTYRVVLTVVDAFSYYIMLFAMPDMKTSTFLEVMKSLLNVLPRVKLITADNQKSIFHNAKAIDFFDKMDINIRCTLAYNSKGNLAEWGNKQARAILRILMADGSLNWPKLLYLVAKLCNETPHHNMGKGIDGLTPVEIAFNRKPDWAIIEEVNNPANSVVARERLRTAINYIRMTRFHANQTRVQDKIACSRIKPGSYVVLKDKDRVNKQLPPYLLEDMFRVIDLDHQHGIKIIPKDETDEEKAFQLNITRVKPVGMLNKRLHQSLPIEEQGHYPNVDSEVDDDMESIEADPTIVLDEPTEEKAQTGDLPNEQIDIDAQEKNVDPNPADGVSKEGRNGDDEEVVVDTTPLPKTPAAKSPEDSVVDPTPKKAKSDSLWKKVKSTLSKPNKRFSKWFRRQVNGDGSIMESPSIDSPLNDRTVDASSNAEYLGDPSTPGDGVDGADTIPVPHLRPEQESTLQCTTIPVESQTRQKYERKAKVPRDYYLMHTQGMEASLKSKETSAE